MKDSNFVKIYTGNFAFVNRIVMELNALDISPVVKDQSESAILGGFGGTLAPDFQEIFVKSPCKFLGYFRETNKSFGLLKR